MRFMRQIDGLRAVAVAMVFFHHFISGKPELGSFGVILFFVISGFLITKILLQMKALIGNGRVSSGRVLQLFYIRRFIRIFPLYFFVLAVLLLLNVGTVRELIWWLVTYTINIWITIHHSFPVAVGHFWSLAVEEQFYFVWPFLVLFIPPRFLRPLLYASIGIAVGFRAVGKLYFHLTPMINALPIAQLDSLSSGALLAVGNYVDRNFLRRAGILLAPVLVFELGMAFLDIGSKIRWLSLELVCALCAASLVSYAAEGIGGFLGRFLEFGPIGFLGRISYGLYVYHMPVYELVKKRSVAVALTVLVAAVSWYCFESPINSLKRYFDYREARSDEGQCDAASSSGVPSIP